MRLTHETPRTRWLVLLITWAFVAVVVVRQSHLMSGYVALLDSLALRGAAPQTPLVRMCPTNYMDAQMWTRYALALQEGAPARIRTTDIDNAPFGREVHWNSAFAHALAAAGRIEQWRHGGTLPRATERALAWFNVPLFLGVVVLLSAWAASRAGAGAGVVVALGLLGSGDFYAGFLPNYVDHHGLLSASVFGLVLGAIFMGGGWWRAGDALLPGSQAAARRAAIASAASGAIGMWVSAATLIPAIGIAGATGVLATWWAGREARAGGAEFSAELWRLWGRVGAGLSMLFYLLEYAPFHLGWRLEVNHPLHALAWWGGAELVAFLTEWRVAGHRPERRGLWLALAIGAIAAPPMMILVFRTKVFLALGFFERLSATVGEGLSLFKAAELVGRSEVLNHINAQLLPLLAGLGLLVVAGRRAGIVLVFAVIGALLFVAMGVWKIRWWLNAGGPLIGLLLVVLATTQYRLAPRWRWPVLLASALACYLPEVLRLDSQLREPTEQHKIGPMDAPQPIFRDIAAVLRASQPQGNIVLLSAPNASTGISYYGRFQTLGTLYWENAPGLKAAAEIFCATTDDEALRLLRARGVTHLAMLSHENYLAQFLYLLRPEAPPGSLEKTFGYRLLVQRAIPVWLRVIPYRTPTDVPMPNLRVLLFQVAPDQTPADALWHIGLEQLAIGDLAPAVENLTRVIEASPVNVRVPRWLEAGKLAYQCGAHAAAAKFLRHAWAEGGDPGAACDLAWVLATSSDATVRNGTEARSIVDALAGQLGGQHLFVGVLAAVLAENGRYTEAATAAEKARALAAAAGDQAAAAVHAERLAAYRVGRPWRQ